MKSTFLARLIQADLTKARELMSQGRSQDALVVALSALQHALAGLKDSLSLLQQHLEKTRLEVQRPESTPGDHLPLEVSQPDPPSRRYH